MQALTAFRNVHRVVLDQSPRPPKAVLEYCLESVWTGDIVEAEVGKVEIGRVAFSKEVILRFLHSHLR